MYKLTKNGEEFDLVEIQTEQLIKKSSDYTELKNIYKFMRDGGAFSGWTPSFMLEPKIGE